MPMQEIQEFVFKYLEYFVGMGGGIGAVLFMVTRKRTKHKNNLTSRVIKLKKYKDSVAKRSKSAI